MVLKVVGHKTFVEINKSLLLFAIMIFIAEDYFCLFQMENKIYSFTSILLLIFGIYQIILKKNIYKNFQYNKLIILYIASILLSCCASTLINGEPFLYSILGARHAFIIMLYYPIKTMVNLYGRDRITTVVLKMGKFIAFVLILQSILYPKIIFINTVSSTRFGKYRNYYFMTIIIFCIMFYFSKIFTNRLEFKDIINLLICLYAFVFVQQTKSAIVAVLLACLLVFILDLTKGKWKYKIIMIFALLLLLYFEKNYFYFQYIEAMNALKEAVTTITGNIGVRIKTVDFILDSIKGHEAFGLGYYYGRWKNATLITGWAYGYAMGDVGIFQQLFHVGYIGVLISILILIKIAVNVHNISRKDQYSYFGKLILIYMLFISIFNYYFTNDTMLFYLCIYMAVFDNSLHVRMT